MKKIKSEKKREKVKDQDGETEIDRQGDREIRS